MNPLSTARGPHAVNMVSEVPNGATEPAKDVELSQSDKNQDHEESLDKVHKEEKVLPDFFPSHGLTTSG